MKFMKNTDTVKAAYGLTIMIVLLLATVPGNVYAQESTDNVTVYFFWGEGCPHCAEEKTFLEEMEQKYGDDIEILMFETWNNKENEELFQKAASAHGIQARGVPTTFIGERNWVGYADYMGTEMESYIQECIQNGCNDLISDSNKENGSGGKTEDLCIHLFISDD